MAVHNGEPYLSDAIDSILSQTFTDFEFIIVDDGSTDNSHNIIQEYALADARIALISSDHCGLAHSLNLAIDRSSGMFIARMDADDVCLPTRIERQVLELEEHDDLVMVGAEVELISSEGLKLGPRKHASDHSELRKQLLRAEGGALTHPVVMIRRSALERVGGYDCAFSTAQDLDLFLKLSEVGRISNIPETLLLWRQHGSSINRTRSNTWPRYRALAIMNTIQRIGVERYAHELFENDELFYFPSSHWELARMALHNARYIDSLKLSYLAYSKDRRLLKFFSFLLSALYRKARQRFPQEHK